MSYSIVIMYVVAVIFAGVGAVLLFGLVRETKERKIYAYRMVGVMALSLGLVLAMSATAMWRWSLAA